MSKQETFDFTSVQKKMKELEDLFSQFSSILTRADDAIHEELTSDDHSALLGDAGSTLLKVWEDNSSTFPDFQKNFAKWSELVAKISLNNKEANQDSGQVIKGNVSIQKTENGGHVVTKVLKGGTTTKFYDKDNNPVKIVMERIDSQDCVVRTTKTNHLIVTDLLKNDGYSVSSSVSQTSDGYYKIVHENGFSEYLDQTGASIGAQEYASSLQNHAGVSFLKEEKPFKEE